MFVISSETRLTSSIDNAATVTLRYQASDVPASTSESTIKPYAWSESEGTWQVISNFTINTSNKTVQFSVSSFVDGSFALLAEPAAEEEAAPPSHGG